MIERIKRIFYRPDFFRDQRFSTSQAMGFYSLTILVFTLASCALLLPRALDLLSATRGGEWQAQREIVQDLYPDDLVLTLERGILTTNQSGPVRIAVPAAWQDDQNPANILVINLDTAISSAEFERLDTFIIANRSEIGLSSPDRGETRIFNLKEVRVRERIEVTSATFDRFIEQAFAGVQVVLGALLFFIPALMYLGLWIGHLIYSLFGALVVWVAANVRGHTLRYGQAYRLALYLLPVPFILSFLMSLAGYHIPFVFTLALFVMALVNFPKSVGSKPIETTEKLPDPVKITATDESVAVKDAEVEEKLREEKR